MTNAATTAPFWHRALARALERRFGKSTMPYEFKRVGNVPAYSDVWRVTDVETGSFVQAVYYAGRLMVRQEHDGAVAGRA